MSMPCAAATAAEYLEAANDYYEKHEYDAAVIQLKNALLLEPDNAGTHLLLGKTYLESGDAVSAEKEILRARDLGVDAAEWMVPLGRTYLQLGRYDGVISDLAVDDSYPGRLRAEIYRIQGNAYLASRRLQAADEKFSAALKLESNNVEAMLGKARVAHLTRDTGGALKHAENALSLEPGNTDAWSLKGELLREQGELERALSAFQNALDIDPGNIPARLGKAATLILLGEPKKALEEVESLPEGYQNLYLANYLKALAMYQQQVVEQAKESLLMALKQNPEHLPSHLLIGRIYYQQGRFGEAEVHFRKYVSSSPANSLATRMLAATLLKLKQPQDAIEVLEHGLPFAREDAAYLALMGSVYLQNQEPARGLEYLERSLEYAPDVPAVRTQLALGQLRQGDYNRATRELQAAVELEQGMLQADVLLVLMYLKQQEYDKAIEAAGNFAERFPDKPLPWNLQGSAYLGQQDYKSARVAFEHAYKLDPEFSTALVNLASLDMLEGKPESARRNYRKVLQIDEGNLKALMALTQLAVATGETEEAAAWLEQARSSNPGAVKPSILLVRLYLQQQETDKALDIARQLELSQPKNPEVLKTLALAQAEAGNDKEAVDTLRTLVNVSTNPAEAHYMLGIIYLKQQKPDSARQSLLRAIGIKDDYPDAQLALAKIHIREKKFPAAQAIADQIKQRHPEASWGYELDGDIRAAGRRLAEAARSYAIAYDKAASRQLALKIYQIYANNRDTGAAIDVLRQWLEAHPEDSLTRIKLATYMHQTGHKQEAVDEYLGVIQREPRNVNALNNLAWLYEELGSEEGLAYAERAYELAAHRPKIIDTLGWLLVQNGENRRGLLLLQEAVTRAPHLPEIRFHMAVAMVKAGRGDEARRELERLLRSEDTFPSSEEARKLLDEIKS